MRRRQAAAELLSIVDMSHPYNVAPIFNFTPVDENGYENQAIQFPDAYFQPWNFDAATHTVPSPISTSDTAQYASFESKVPRINAPQPRKRSGRNVQYLKPPRPQPPASRQTNVEPIVDPIARFYSSDEPWNPHQMRHPDPGNSQSIFQSDYGHYRQRPPSEMDNISDSGYQTQRPLSVLSNEPGRSAQELPSDFLFKARSMNVNAVPNAAQPMLHTASDQRSVLSQHSSRSGASRQLIPCPDPTCPMVSKCKSEHKKHMLKHEKNFMCTETGCKRAGQGFSTINDLDRHRKSVHNIGVANSKSYKCAADDCTNKDKIWPRLDNFKQHVQRMHKSHNAFDLIKLSEYNRQARSSETHEPLSTDPALFAGIGGSDSNFLSPSSYLSYQPTLSFTTSTMTSTAEVSPSTTSHDTSFSPFDVSAPVHENAKMHMGVSLSPSIDATPSLSVGHRWSMKTSPTRIASTTTLAPGSHQKRKSASKTHLSNEPQTKSEQVQLALAKLPKADINIEELVQALPESDKARVSQAIVNLLKQKSATTRLPQRRATQDSASGPGQHCNHQGCTFVGRTCDLNKHKKRHARPYGCTYPKCHKRFGAKSDWKRHENSQHFQLDAFHCDHLNSSGTKCGMHWHRSAQFKKHLQDKHKITADGEIEDRLRRCKIGKNCQGQFWCGFCREIKLLKSKRNAAWDERFDHIAHHFEKEIRSIEDWLCVEANRTKKELQAEIDREAFPDDNEMEVDAEADTDDDAPPEAQDISAPMTTGALEPSMRVVSQQRTVLWTCCYARHGPHVYSGQAICPECSHVHCDNCERFFADDGEADLLSSDDLIPESLRR